MIGIVNVFVWLFRGVGMNQSERATSQHNNMLLALDSLQSKIWTALPCRVDSVMGNTINATPLIKADVKGEYIEMPMLLDVLVVFPSAGGFSITFPIKPGDDVLVIFSSRCIDAWFENDVISVPTEHRMHDLSDGFAIPGIKSNPKALTDIQEDGVEMRTDDRSTYIRLTDGTIYIKGKIEHEGDYDQSGDMNRTGKSTTSGVITGNGGMSIDGGDGSRFSGDIEHTDGTITSLGKKIDGTHTHDYSAGGGTTQGPNT